MHAGAPTHEQRAGGCRPGEESQELGYLSIYLSIYISIYLFIYLSIYRR